MKVVLLAAGLSSRMRCGNKLLIPLPGGSLLERALENALSYCGDVTLVCGNDSDRICSAAGKYGVNILYNPDYASGQETSIRTALENLDGPLAILPCDLPLINPDCYLECERMLAGHSAARPLYKGTAGHPVALSQEAVELYRSSGVRLRDLLKSLDTNFYATSHEAAVHDIDTDAELERFRAEVSSPLHQ